MGSKENCRLPTSFNLDSSSRACQFADPLSGTSTGNTRQFLSRFHADFSHYRDPLCYGLRLGFLSYIIVRLALSPKAANLYIYLYDRFSDGLTGFSWFAPTAGVASAPLSKSSRTSFALGQRIRAGSHPAAAVTTNRDFHRRPRHQTKPVSVMLYLMGKADRGTEEGAQLGCTQ